MQNLKFLQEFNSHSNYLKHFAIKLTRDKNRADDLFQETALNAFRHQKKYTENTNLKAWLSTIMKNSFINLYRKQKRRNELQDTTREDFYLNESKEVIRNEGEISVNMRDIFKLIDELDEGYRVPFMMAYKGYQYDEIQKSMGGLPMGTIKSRIFNARKILKSKIKELYKEVAA